MSKLRQHSVPLNYIDFIHESIKLSQESEKNYILVREHDDFTHYSKDITWVEWNEDGTFKQGYDEPMVGRSLLMSPFNNYFTWLTTEIVEILENQENFIKFKTKNSIYELRR